MFKKIFVIASAIFVLAVAGVLGWMHIMGDNSDFAKKGAQIVHVKVGMTTADIADMLHEKQLIKNPKAFKFEARFKGLATKLQAGMYKIEGGMSNGAIVNEFANGRIELIDFIVPEYTSDSQIPSHRVPPGSHLYPENMLLPACPTSSV